MRWKTAAPLILCASLLARPALAAEPRQGGCPGNRLANPAFDGGSHKTEGEGTSLSSAVADGWHPWFVRGGETVNREPEFKVEQVAIGGDPYRVRSGGQSMKWFTTWATHDAGIFQQVAVWAGAEVTFSIYAMAYTGEADGWNPEIGTHLSDPDRPGNYRMWVGIDPTGAVPLGMGSAPPPTVVWSAPAMTYDQWVRLAVTTVAQSGTVTVYARGKPEFSVKHNDSFWDDACLTATGGPAAKSAPAASDLGADEGPRPIPLLPGSLAYLPRHRAIPW